ncbi:MAG: acyltransferase, partial [Myxococcaceae bacterium]|nr:acyltransferase [Myxococcaceae bacterium]
SAALRDVRTFFVLGTKKSFKQQLVREGDALAAELEKLVAELSPRFAAPAA